MRFAASTRKPAPIYAQNNTRTPDDKSHAAISMRSASTDSKTPYNYAHTSTPKAASSRRYTAAKKKRTNRPQPQPPHRRGTFHRQLQPFYTEKHKVSCSGFLPKPSPCNIMQPLQCGSQHQLANLHLSTHRTTPEHQMTRVMQPFQCDLQAQIPKHPITTHTHTHTHTSTPKAASSRRYTAAKKKEQTDPSRNRRTDEVPFIAGCSHFTWKTQGFVLRLPPQNIAHATSCSHCNAVRSINSQTCTYLRTEQHQNTRWQESCSHANAMIPKHPIYNYAHTSTPKAASSRRYNAAKRTNRPQPQPPHRRGTFHRRLQPFYMEKHKASCSGLLPNSPLAFVHFPSSPLPFLTTSHRPHLPSSPFAFIITSLRHHFPSSPLPVITTSLPHHFLSSPLPFLTTSRHHHFPSWSLPIVTTSHRHHFPSSPPPFLTTSRHHFPSSPLPFLTTSHRHHFPSSPPPFLTTSLRHHFPSSPLFFVTTRHCQHPSSRSIPPRLILLLCIVTSCIVNPILLWCIDMFCIVVWSTTLHHFKSQNSICP